MGFHAKQKTPAVHSLVKSPGTLERFKIILSVEIETVLTKHAIQLRQMLFGLTTADLRKLAFDVVVKLNILHQFNKDNQAKTGWRIFSVVIHS